MKRVTVTTVNNNLTVISGYESRELVTLVRGGRHPMWSRRPRGWVVQSQTARDVIALAEERGFDVVLVDAQEAA